MKITMKTCLVGALCVTGTSAVNDSPAEPQSNSPAEPQSNSPAEPQSNSPAEPQSDSKPVSPADSGSEETKTKKPVSSVIASAAGSAFANLTPNHICAVLVLATSAAGPWDAAVGGASWAAAHSLAKLVMFTIAGIATNIHPKAKDGMQGFIGHYGGYAAGIMLLCLAIYFLIKRRNYFDKEYKPLKGVCDHSKGGSDGHGHSHGQCDESAEPVQETFIQKWGLLLFGFVQGLFCPDVMVALFFLLKESGLNCLLWIVVHIPVSIIVVGAAGFVLKMCTGLGNPGLATKVLFLGMCYLTLFIGVGMLGQKVSPDNFKWMPEFLVGHSH